MKKISLFILSVFAIGSAMAQSNEDFTHVPIISDNMSVVVQTGLLDNFIGDEIQAYVVKYEYASPMDEFMGIASDSAFYPTSLSTTITTDPTALVVQGSDDFCNCADVQAVVGDQIRFFIRSGSGDDIVFVTIDLVPDVTFAIGGFYSDFETIAFSVDGEAVVFGCDDDAYTEFSADVNWSDESCATIAIWGCTDQAGCNYNDAANSDDGSCTIASGCESCSGDTDGSGTVLANDVDGDGVCDADEVVGCQDDSACNYNAAATDSGACTFPVGCDSCSGEDDGSGVVVNNDADGDGICNADEIPGCQDSAAFNYSAEATDDDGSCYDVNEGCLNPQADNYNDYDGDGESNDLTGDVYVDINTANADLCMYSQLNPWGTGGTVDAPAYITGNNMSVLVQAGETGNLNNFEGIEAGDVLFAAYETDRLTDGYVNYSEVSAMNSAGAFVWDGTQGGLAVFGEGPDDDGYGEGEELLWLLAKEEAGETVIYNVTPTYAVGMASTWEAGEFLVINDLVIGSRFYDGCMDPTSPSFNPMATEDDGSCTTPYSVGCMDISAVNYAGAGANPTHSDAENFGDAFMQNLGYNLNDGATTSASGIAATISEDGMCQDQVRGCTDPMANNYDPANTMNGSDNEDCDWTLNGMTVYNVDPVTGESLGTDYSFGAVDSSNENDGIVGSDFDHAQLLFDEGALNPDGHVIDNLADVMEWIEMDESRDAQELADTITDMQQRYDDNEAQWVSDYNSMENYLEDSIHNTLDSAQTAHNEYVDERNSELADTIFDMQNRFDNNDSTWVADYNAMVAEKDAAYAALLLRVTGSETGDVEVYNTGYHYYNVDPVTDNGIIAELQSALDYHSSPIQIDLDEQWNTVAYYLQHPTDVVEQFLSNYTDHQDIESNINIVKNNDGDFYWPDFGYNGIEALLPGQGYQVRVKEGTGGKPGFTWDSSISPDENRLLNPMVPTWAVEMEVQNHPNDIRTLVRVVNMLGQEVNPAEQFNGEVLLYMYNDGTVEKKMVE
jgi:hypothetical protein